ncbi:ACP S-malonyltransferase [Nostocaceae cyanobacterium CENA369]|uniref:ACP S-malonyltransferase n=1 Tax=Dendronalium phyllosphericum CENA369 TaxID=1725256 RepID=A0A8J7I9H1_9NOST|nr:ACP S-malonyltransferase [Dendronalium phyllosphericum]MBH8576383.1 ACP S-malonyltransferase [Dendronalium phyllosphericum CENA369]
MIFLIDHNIEGQAAWLWETIFAEGWLDWVTLGFITFEEVALPIDSSDRFVWRFAQENKMIILTANRSMEGEDSLEKTIRDENNINSLPVITIAKVDRMVERSYREKCAVRLIEILIDIENSMGVGRIFIP